MSADFYNRILIIYFLLRIKSFRQRKNNQGEILNMKLKTKTYNITKTKNQIMISLAAKWFIIK